MRAIRYHAFGGPEQVCSDDIALPEARAGEMLVDVAATSVNPADWKIGAGYLRGVIDYPLPFVPGLDFAGTVRVPSSPFAVGDAVYGALPLDRIGTYADVISVPAAVAALAPRSIPLTMAAAVPLAALTAWHATLGADHANVQRGQTVLIHGAAGGTGMFSVQFAKWRGARVLATASAENADYVRGLGADVVIDYCNERFEGIARDLDAVVDLVGGDVQARSLPLLRAGGVLTSIVAQPPPAPSVRTTLMNAGSRDPAILAQVAELIDSAHVRVHVTEIVPLAEAGAALARNRAGHARGKVVVRVL
ncbi:MAG TPA: NADP-dependent oxidoreductase [Kofleriaceae bacterium]|jgi:NADPH:quinone reductase-like Zn-dependent oxidoreductase|nr:NADP-dependent oxidoreductase [Kofleriaceae bacterium]